MVPHVEAHPCITSQKVLGSKSGTNMQFHVVVLMENQWPARTPILVNKRFPLRTCVNMPEPLAPYVLRAFSGPVFPMLRVEPEDVDSRKGAVQERYC